MSSHDGSKTGQIATDENTFGMSEPVMSVACNPILRQFPKEHITENGSRRLLTTCYLVGHGAMNTHQSCIGNCVEQYRDVTMTNEPFRMLEIAFLRNTIEQMYRTISTTGTQAGFDAVVFECPKNIGRAFFCRSCIDIDIQIVCVGTDNRLQSPTFNGFCSLRKHILGNPVSWGHQSYPIAFL